MEITDKSSEEYRNQRYNQTHIQFHDTRTSKCYFFDVKNNNITN